MLMEDTIAALDGLRRMRARSAQTCRLDSMDALVSAWAAFFRLAGDRTRAERF